MKKFLVMVLVFCMLAGTTSVFADVANRQIVIDGEVVAIPEEMGTICERDDRTFVPIRFLMENFGHIVVYEPSQQSATITDPETKISYFMMAGRNDLFMLSLGETKTVKMDTKVFINNEEGRMYVPLRYIAEIIGYKVDWDAETDTVVLTSQN